MINDMLTGLPDTNKNVICILSGGLDSTILLYLLKKKYGDNVIALSFNYNQRHDYELKCATATCKKTNTPHQIIDIGFFGDVVANVSALSNSKNVDVPNIKDVLGEPQPVTYVPFRNLMFISIALGFAESNDATHVFIGLQAHDLYMYWDTTPDFVERVNSVANLNREHLISIEAPFVDLNKCDEIKIGNELGVDFGDTWTCYTGPCIEVDNNNFGHFHMLACGTCPSCAERIKNFMDADVKDPVEYKVKTPWDN